MMDAFVHVDSRKISSDETVGTLAVLIGATLLFLPSLLSIPGFPRILVTNPRTTLLFCGLLFWLVFLGFLVIAQRRSNWLQLRLESFAAWLKSHLLASIGLGLVGLGIWVTLLVAVKEIFSFYSIPFGILAVTGIILCGALWFTWLVVGAQPTRLFPGVPFPFQATLLVVIVGSIGVGMYLWGANLDAQWRYSDDQETMTMLGPQHVLAIQDLAPYLLKNASVIPFRGVRFQPFDVAARLLQTFLFRDNPFLWYLGRIFFFVVAMSLLWLVLNRWLGLLYSFLFTMVVLTYSFWGDVYARLGSSECIAAAACALYAFAFIELLRSCCASGTSPWSKRIFWGLYVAAAALAIGTKENFVILVVPNLVLFGVLWWRKKLDLAAWVCLVAVTLFGGLAILSILVGVIRSGTDAYANNAGLGYRLSLLSRVLKNLLTGNLAFILVGLGVVMLLLIYRVQTVADAVKRRALYRLGLQFLAGALALAALYLSQAIFYNGNWPSNDRYDFPGRMAEPFFLLLCFWFIGKAAQLAFTRPFFANYIHLVLGFGFLAIIALNGYAPLRAASDANVTLTRTYTGQIGAIAQTLNAEPDAALILETHASWDLEPAAAVVIFLRYAGITNPIYLAYYDDPANQLGSPFSVATGKLLRDQSNGSTPSKLYLPLGQFKDGKCYSVTFSGDNHQCPVLARIL